MMHGLCFQTQTEKQEEKAKELMKEQKEAKEKDKEGLLSMLKINAGTPCIY